MAPRYKSKIPQLKFDFATKDELAKTIADKLGGDYFEYEVRDFLDALGPAIQELLLAGKQVHIQNLGKFRISTNGKREYWNVNKKCKAISHGSFTVKFKVTTSVRDAVSSKIKQLMIQTMRLQADTLIENESEVKE